MENENFGYSLPGKEVTNPDFLQTFRRDISTYKKYAFITLLEIGVVHYLRERYAGNLPEAWDGAYFSATILAEVYLVGSFLYSLYCWRDISKHASELERRI